MDPPTFVVVVIREASVTAFSLNALICVRLTALARPAGFEPTTLGFGGQYSDPLSYGRFSKLKSYLYQGDRDTVSEHDQHSSFIKTPQQLIAVVVAAFLVPIIGIILLVQLVTSRPHADPNALAPESIAARIQPVGKVEFGGASAAGGGARSGEEIVKATCGTCHLAGVAGAPKIGDKAAWAPHLQHGLDAMLKNAIAGIKAMPPRGGDASLTDTELARAIVHMANQSGGKLKEPAAPAKPAAAQSAAATPAAGHDQH